MPLIRPLRALHYGSDLYPLLADLITPARVGEPTDRREIGEVHDLNIRRLVRGDFGSLASDDEPSFSHAARLLQGWKERGVLVRDPRPALYVYEQSWDGISRRGMVALVRLDDGDERLVRPHEQTLGGSTDALFAQLKATTTQLSMTMAMLEDNSGSLATFLDGFDSEHPGLETLDGKGMTSRVWRDESPAVHIELGDALRAEVAVLADGHHRHQAALRYQEWRRNTPPLPGRRREHPCDYIMMMLVPQSSAGLICLPTHRVCERLNSGARRLVETLDQMFEIREVDSDAALFSFLAESGGNRFAMIHGGQRCTMLLRDQVRARLVGLPEGVRDVDAAILDELVLSPMNEALGSISESMADAGASGSPWGHNRSSAQEIIDQVLAGDADLAILVRPPAPSQVMQVALANQLMPPKSTNFHPKPIKGLLMSSLHSF